ncbi:MAG: hypothetical protein IK099_03520 [Clostridia bacterium]|nr:hypothetical protein [Clostridia bacterium]
MFKLMKYEFRKTWITKLIVLGITAAAEAAFLINLYTNNENSLAASIGILTLIAIFGILVIGLQSVITLHRDMNTKQGYMLFMTPNSCYKILGAKVLENGLSILVGGAFFFGLGALDVTLLFAKEGQLNQIWEMVQEVLRTFNEQIPLTADALAAFTFNLLTSWICTVVTAYLADVISSALLNGKSFNGIISFVIFLALSWGTEWLNGISTRNIQDVITSLVIQGGISLLTAAVMYVVTAQIMEKKLSV